MTLLQTSVQKKITPHVLAQFPEFYREHGPGFIRFVTAYYDWMETEGPLYDTRRVFDYKDIDSTTEAFLIHFKNKYLPDIQLETESNVRFLVKHSLDLYRSRGTPRAVDLLFRLVFGRGAKVYYPWRDLFRTSDGKWTRPRYLEVSLRNDLSRFLNKDIVGVSSGASAFVERVIRKHTGTKFVDLLYISSVEGEFSTGEIINASQSPFELSTCPKIIGSLSELEIIDGGVDFQVGDIVDIESNQGVGGKARIKEISEITGLIDFELVSGGFGYSSNAEVLIANSTMVLDQVVLGTPDNDDGFHSLFERLEQPMGLVNYTNATANLVTGEGILTYHANGSIKGTGIVIGSSPADSDTGALHVSVLTGNLDANMIYTTGNLKSVVIPVSNGYNDFTASGNVIGETSTAVLRLANVSTPFLEGETLDDSSSVVIRWVQSGSNGVMTVDRRHPFTVNQTITGASSGATGKVSSVQARVGLIDTNGSFIISNSAPIRGSDSNTTSFVTSISEGEGASFVISTDLIYPETLVINGEYIEDFETIDLDDEYGFIDMPNANLNTIIADALSVTPFEVGKIQAIIRTNPGEEYDAAPIVRIYEPYTATEDLLDYEIGYANASASFSIGEVITQSDTGAKGMVILANSTVLQVERLSVAASFTHTTNTTTRIVGESSGTSANVAWVIPTEIDQPRDLRGHEMGLNAVILSELTGGNGYAISAEVVDSGYGYADLETVNLKNPHFNGVDAQATTRLLRSGKGTGYYKKKGGFTSDQKKIHDGDYWQEYSYEVQSSVNYTRYKDMLAALLHVAGTKPFGAFYHSTLAGFGREASNARITVSEIE